jgi:hypothetical protein
MPDQFFAFIAALLMVTDSLHALQRTVWGSLVGSSSGMIGAFLRWAPA